jgi:hypothetical protein
MGQLPTTYITTPRGKSRFWGSILALGVPALLVYIYVADPAEWHVSGMTKLLCQLLLLAMLVAMFAAGLYLALFVRTVVLDIPGGGVTRLTRVFGKIIHRKGWSLSEFTRIELRHYCAGSDTDTFQSDVGMRHGSGGVVWLRAFLIKSDKPSPEALTFAKELSETTGLQYEK